MLLLRYKLEPFVRGEIPTNQKAAAVPFELWQNGSKDEGEAKASDGIPENCSVPWDGLTEIRSRTTWTSRLVHFNLDWRQPFVGTR
jgi:hypothetical protein